MASESAMVRGVLRALGAAVWCATVAGCATPPPPPEQHEIDFKAQLNRQGEWLVVRPYGRVWHPHPRLVGPAFVPYLSGGHWTHGKDGWSFESDWAWLALTFHYGRWFMGQDLGWVWLPDQEFAVAWVDWRFGGEFVGWSPAPPPPPANASIPPEPQRWTFVKIRHLTQADLLVHRLPPEAISRALELAPPLAGRVGPEVAQVQAQGGLTSDGGVPDLTPPPEPPPVIAPAEVQKEDPPPRPPPKKKSKKRAKPRP